MNNQQHFFSCGCRLHACAEHHNEVQLRKLEEVDRKLGKSVDYYLSGEVQAASPEPAVHFPSAPCREQGHAWEQLDDGTLLCFECNARTNP